MEPDFKLFTDRTLISLLPQELVADMKFQGLIVSKDTHVSFCGAVHYSLGIAIFMPRNTTLATIEKPKQAAANLIYAIKRYFQKTDKGIYSSDSDEGLHGGNQLELMLDLLEDYSQNGLCSKRVIERKVNTGKTDWNRTINRSSSFPSRSSPIYFDVFGTRRKYVSVGETARIHAAVIRSLDSILGWVISGGGSLADPNLLDIPEPSGDIADQIIALEFALIDAYSDRDIFLINALLRYLREQRGDDQSNRAIGLRLFEGMWEHMLDCSLQWTHDVNHLLAAPVYKIKGEYHLAAKKGQRTDTVLKHPDEKIYTVIDAKYYEAAEKETAPGWPDLVKQFYYQRALKLIYNDAVVNNVFVFPGADGDIESAHVARRGKSPITVTDLLKEEYPEIRCVYLDPVKLMEHYLVDRKLRDLSLELLSVE